MTAIGREACPQDHRVSGGLGVVLGVFGAGKKLELRSGPCRAGVEAEITELNEARPGLAEVAPAMARILDNPKAVNQ
jgi:hypothetical protein